MDLEPFNVLDKSLFLNKKRNWTEFVINVYFDFNPEITGFYVQCDNVMHLYRIVLLNLADYGSLGCKHQ